MTVLTHLSNLVNFSWLYEELTGRFKLIRSGGIFWVNNLLHIYSDTDFFGSVLKQYGEYLRVQP